jgi:hypothetical protein
MSYTLEPSVVQGCLRIRVSGAWPSGRSDEIISEIFSLWEKHQKPLLIDLRDMEDSPSIFSDYFDAKQFATAGFRSAGLIAVLDNPDRREANTFFETTAHNRGLRFAFFYSDEEEAIARIS